MNNQKEFDGWVNSLKITSPRLFVALFTARFVECRRVGADVVVHIGVETGFEQSEIVAAIDAEEKMLELLPSSCRRIEVSIMKVH